MARCSYTSPTRIRRIKHLGGKPTQFLHNGNSMAFLTDKEELKPGLVIFRRADVQHRNWYCRIKIPKEDRYKTVSLKTPDINKAKTQAFDEDADVRALVRNQIPVFEKSFAQV